jgi:hypothetical protein
MHSRGGRDLLKEAGVADEPDKIPLEWDEHRAFRKKAQDALRKKDPAKSSRASDTIYTFEMALLSFGGQLISDGGKVIVDQRPARILSVRWTMSSQWWLLNLIMEDIGVGTVHWLASRWTAIGAWSSFTSGSTCRSGR